MIETKNPEISVDEIMIKIRNEIANRSLTPLPEPSSSISDTGETKPVFDDIRVMESLQTAQQCADTGIGVLAMTRFSMALRWFARLSGHIVNYLTQVITVPQRKFNHAVLQILENMIHAVRESDTSMRYLKESVCVWDLNQALIDGNDRIASLRADVVSGFAARDSYFDRLQKSFSRMTVEWDKQIVGLRDQIADILKGSTDANDRLQKSFSRMTVEWDKQIVGLREQTVGLRDQIDSLRTSLEKDAGELDELNKNTAFLKTNRILQERRLDRFLEEAEKRLPAPFDEKHLEVFADEKSHLLDLQYSFFEDRFRGSRKEIKKRLRVYLPWIKESGAGTDDRPVIDAGCGRGEWLELLKEEGLTAKGVDLNRVLVERCQKQGLEAAEKDVVQDLAALPADTLGAVTAFHLIEHLHFSVLMRFVDEVVRVLKLGGLIIFETPNPENVRVGSYSFYFDPTHRKPLPSTVIKFLIESKGFSRVKVLPLNPVGEEEKVKGDDSELARRFNKYFYGPRDYAVIGYKV